MDYIFMDACYAGKKISTRQMRASAVPICTIEGVKEELLAASEPFHYNMKSTGRTQHINGAATQALGSFQAGMYFQNNSKNVFENYYDEEIAQLAAFTPKAIVSTVWHYSFNDAVPSGTLLPELRKVVYQTIDENVENFMTMDPTDLKEYLKSGALIYMRQCMGARKIPEGGPGVTDIALVSTANDASKDWKADILVTTTDLDVEGLVKLVRASNPESRLHVSTATFSCLEAKYGF